jgi:hypothetical protein
MHGGLSSMHINYNRRPMSRKSIHHRQWRSLLGGTMWIERRALRNAEDKHAAGFTGATAGVHGGLSDTNSRAVLPLQWIARRGLQRLQTTMNRIGAASRITGVRWGVSGTYNYYNECMEDSPVQQRSSVATAITTKHADMSPVEELEWSCITGVGVRWIPQHREVQTESHNLSDGSPGSDFPNLLQNLGPPGIITAIRRCDTTNRGRAQECQSRNNKRTESLQYESIDDRQQESGTY